MERPPARSGSPAQPDLLVSGEGDRLGLTGLRRRAVVAGAALAVATGVAATEVRDRQAADAEQRQQAAAAALAVESARAAEQRARDAELRRACGRGTPLRYANRQERDEAYEVGLGVRAPGLVDDLRLALRRSACAP